MTQTLLPYWLYLDEPMGFALGFAIVVCFIRQSVWAWPLGIVYVAVSVSVLLEARLYANLALHVLAFLPMNVYGWYYWLYAKREDETELPVTRASARLLAIVVGVCAASTAILGTIFAYATNAALPYWDNVLLVGSVAAMWLTARKKIENWIFWLGIDAISVGVYWAQGLPLYATLYFVYVGMAVAGWIQWRKSMPSAAAQEA